jgi:hypothetical protein
MQTLFGGYHPGGGLRGQNPSGPMPSAMVRNVWIGHRSTNGVTLKFKTPLSRDSIYLENNKSPVIFILGIPFFPIPSTQVATGVTASSNEPLTPAWSKTFCRRVSSLKPMSPHSLGQMKKSYRSEGRGWKPCKIVIAVSPGAITGQRMFLSPLRALASTRQYGIIHMDIVVESQWRFHTWPPRQSGGFGLLDVTAAIFISRVKFSVTPSD